MTTLAGKGLAFQQALFVPPESSYRKLGAPEQHPNPNRDLSWQQGLQKVYQSHLTSNGVRPSTPCRGPWVLTSNSMGFPFHILSPCKHGSLCITGV